MDLGLVDKVAVVLAGTAGLGRACAEALRAEGARVAVCGRDEARLDAAREALAAAGPGGSDAVHGAPLDVTDTGALTRFLDAVRERWGAVHVLVTNAGGPPPGAASEVDDRALAAAVELTLRSAVAATRAVLPGMRARRWGRIVGLTSVSVREPIPDLALSNVARSGLTAWFKSLSAEVARDGVLVNTVCTGLFDTERLAALLASRARRSGRTEDEERRVAAGALPIGRFGDPREMGALVAWLCSERNGFLTGAAIPLDGGAGRSLL